MFERTLESLVYVIRTDNDEMSILLQYRHKPPNQHLWVPLGEQIRSDESPYGAATRVLDKQGLTATEVRYKGIVTESSPEGKWQCFLHIYVASSFIGELTLETEEGRLSWFPLSQIAALPKPQADSNFNLRFLQTSQSFYEASMLFDGAGQLVSVEERN